MTAELDALIERLAAATDQEEIDQLALVEIPDHMFLELGLREHVTASGLRVTIDESLVINVKQRHRRALHAWLRDNGHMEEFSKLCSFAQNKNATRKVETAVLDPLVTRLLEEGAPIDLDLFGVSRVVIARLSDDSSHSSPNRRVRSESSLD